MLRVGLKNLWNHKLRTLLLGLAVVAGVGFVTASYVFTDSLSLAFEDAFAATTEGIDIEVGPSQEPGSGLGDDAFPRIDADLIEAVAAVEGVSSATPYLQGFATLVIEGEDAQPFGAPDFVISWSGGNLNIGAGRPPEADGEVVVDAGSAESRGIGVGDTIRISGGGRAEAYEVVGTFRFGDTAGLGATFLALPTEAAAELLGAEGRVNSISVVVAEGADTEAVLTDIAAVLPPEAQARDSRAIAEEQAAQLQQGLGFFNTFLLVFGGIALIVGSFVVYNAFRVVVAQRGRELALLRVLGATRGQLVRSVLGEALVVGVLASVIGVAVGLGLAVLIRSLLAATGTDLPNAGLVLSPRTVVVGLVVGVATTLLSALVPALRTTRISPMEALRDQPELRPIRRWWAVVGIVLLAGAGILVATGVSQAFDEAAITGNTDPLVLVGIGCLLAFASFFLLARIMVRPVLGILGRGARSISARLGRENARRTPRRTAVTATALMIGLGLVATVAVLSRSVEDTILQAVEEGFSADILIQPGGFDALSGIPVEIAEEVAGVEGVAEVARLNMVQGTLPEDQGVTMLVGVEPETVELAIAFDSVEGSFEDLGPGGLAVQRIEADKLGLSLGDTVDLQINDEPYPVEVVAIFDLGGEVSDSASYYLEYGAVAELQPQPLDFAVAIGVDPAADVGETSDRLATELEDFPGVAVTTLGDLVDQIQAGLNAVVGMVAGLLLMSVLVAVVGIVLTLYLAVHERTRETGLLRAVGMTRPQVRRMIRFESILIAVFGTLLGIVLGLFCGWALSIGVVGAGVRLGVPWVWIVGGLLGALVAGVVAAVIPARRAARMDVLAAIAYE
jgi:putative ABC transport system permease protein